MSVNNRRARDLFIGDHSNLGVLIAANLFISGYKHSSFRPLPLLSVGRYHSLLVAKV